MKTSKILVMLTLAVSAAPAVGQWMGDDELGASLSPDQLKKILAEALTRRMTLERSQVAVEIREGMLFLPEQVEPAIQRLNDKPANGWEDNAKRTCEAFAAVDMRFGPAYRAMKAGRYAEAATLIKPLISRRDTTYLAATQQYCYAESLYRSGKYQDAADAYTELVRNMPDRFSFAAMALLRAAEAYEKLHRNYSAMALYKAWVDSFGLLDTQLAGKLSARAAKIEADYKDPLGTLARNMGQAHALLAEADSGRRTQRKQQMIIEMLDDLIAMAEEQSPSGGKGRGKQGQGKQKSCSSCGGKGCGSCGGKGKGGSKGGGPKGLGVPSASAQVSALVGGDSPRPEGRAEIRPSGPGDDWGRLPPRERDKLIETFRETMPELYRDMLRDYYRTMAGEGKR